ncbi:MAG: phosphate/phosphite/phosphonate ABC transporter substrate-binding protein [Rhodospirillaceae bacterium]|nr:phosphate/phosphite/phosphonate ABC transporter substrate-binding protein [Rhodospirillaceae bacterium]
MRTLIALALLSLLPGASAAAQQACAHGALDTRYCDADGDMVPDVPTDPKQLLDPDTLIYSYTPLEDPSVYAKMWDGFIVHMEKTTGKKVRLFQVQSNAAQLEALRSGRLHVTGVNTGSVPVAVNCTGYVPFSIMAGPAGIHSYHMEIIVPAGSPIQSPKDLKGRTVAYTSPTSNSGFNAPAFILESEFGLKVDADYKTTFSGKHDNSILGVVNGDYEAAAVASTVLDRMAARKAYDPAKIRSIFKSKTFPTTAYGYAYNLKPELAEKIRQAFFTYDMGQDQAMLKEFPGQEHFVPMDYKTTWQIVREIDAGTGVKYDCK